ncbi:hypothetical protein N7523_007406 [Penicillium sp. IBT 18751x]|nr:hypothetical protein N7523_007406 [Penicillium sp. IBT 18751x]
MTSGQYTDCVNNADDDDIPPSGLVIDLKEQGRNVDAGRPLVSLVCGRDEYPDQGHPDRVTDHSKERGAIYGRILVWVSFLAYQK